MKKSGETAGSTTPSNSNTPGAATASHGATPANGIGISTSTLPTGGDATGVQHKRKYHAYPPDPDPGGGGGGEDGTTRTGTALKFAQAFPSTHRIVWAPKVATCILLLLGLAFTKYCKCGVACA